MIDLSARAEFLPGAWPGVWLTTYQRRSRLKLQPRHLSGRYRTRGARLAHSWGRGRDSRVCVWPLSYSWMSLLSTLLSLGEYRRRITSPRAGGGLLSVGSELYTTIPFHICHKRSCLAHLVSCRSRSGNALGISQNSRGTPPGHPPPRALALPARFEAFPSSRGGFLGSGRSPPAWGGRPISFRARYLPGPGWGWSPPGSVASGPGSGSPARDGSLSARVGEPSVRGSCTSITPGLGGTTHTGGVVGRYTMLHNTPSPSLPPRQHTAPVFVPQISIFIIRSIFFLFIYFCTFSGRPGWLTLLLSMAGWGWGGLQGGCGGRGANFTTFKGLVGWLSVETCFNRLLQR